MGTEERKGIIYTAFAYTLWGLLPIYWKLVEHVPADEILANRIFWSFWFMLILLVATRQFKAFRSETFSLLKRKKRFAALVTASVLISINWFVYIWAVNSGQMVEASLGYYINPLVSVLLGVLVLKELMSRAQVLSFVLALIGVLILTISYGQFPWIAFILAFSFGLYGLVKKMLKVNAAIGLTLETLTIMPIALLYLGYLGTAGDLALFNVSFGTDFLLVAAGAATAIPLLLFANGAQRIPLFMVGFLQYIAPTITLILGVFFYGEPFNAVDLISFIFIWMGLAVFTISRTKWAMQVPVRRKKAV
ncbi:EamA family transporter RarD [Jeotgalibacillus aurantiacus]|uniref:EamA family transporter RarD n=1 Tax=Jeotgalibacillus aurantiacus TaxID=2763266 RepID=UPI001D0AFB05|nr:EamA family transporter RarD [Jeotgalibacillus aurantiacus]